MTTSRSLIAAVFVFLTFASIYLVAVVELDNTNIGTTNGLWKTPTIRGWEKVTGHKLDSGEWLYPPLYGLLCRLIPDRWVSYGIHGPVVTFRKIALLNAMFGGLASGAVFLLAVRFLVSVFASLVAVLGHACAAFVILNSINSEDIIPAYTFFVLTVLCLFAYLDSDRIVYFIGSIFCCAMLTLLHWTLMIPTLAGVVSVGLVLLVEDRRRAWMLPVFFGLFLILLELFRLGFGPSKSSEMKWVLSASQSPTGSVGFERIDSVWHILYPSKTALDGFLGFRWTKVTYAFIGIGNYFLGGRYVGDYRAAFADPNSVGWMGMSWLFAMVTLGALVWASIRRSSTEMVRLLAVFGLAVFSVGEMEHLYAQPQDPQSQIQPMFATILGVIVILEGLRRIDRPYKVRLLALALGGIFLLAGGYNALLMLGSRGEDGRFMKEANELAQAFPPETTVMVTQGWEEWNTWIYAETFGGDWTRYLERNIGLVNGFIRHPGVTPTDVADLMAKQIADEMAKGHRVVANVVWAGSRDDFAYSLTNVADIEPARIYTDRLYGAFRVGRSWDTSAGRFVELQK